VLVHRAVAADLDPRADPRIEKVVLEVDVDPFDGDVPQEQETDLIRELLRGLLHARHRSEDGRVALGSCLRTIAIRRRGSLTRHSHVWMISMRPKPRTMWKLTSWWPKSTAGLGS